jgi:hypothetical protein
MKFRMDEPLRFWVDVAYENIKSDHPKLTKRQVIAQILHQYQAATPCGIWTSKGKLRGKRVRDF